MDLVDKYLDLDEEKYKDKPYGSKKNIEQGQKKYQTKDPAHQKHGIRGILDKLKWNENPEYKKSARPPEKKNKGRGLTKD